MLPKQKEFGIHKKLQVQVSLDTMLPKQKEFEEFGIQEELQVHVYVPRCFLNKKNLVSRKSYKYMYH